MLSRPKLLNCMGWIRIDFRSPGTTSGLKSILSRSFLRHLKSI